MNQPPPEIIRNLRAFLREDIRSGDITTNSIEPFDADGVGTIYAKSKAILAGLEEVVAIAGFSGIKYEVLTFEGNWVNPGDAIIRLKGPAKSLLMIERVCLNIVMRMSGIATMAYRMVEATKKAGKKVIVAATRKTTPGFRYFEKRAVVVGGGDSHRYALDDMVLIKNNHIAVVGGVRQAIEGAKRSVSFSKKISCEVRNLNEALEAIDVGADIILLDNFRAEDVAGVHKVLTEKGLRDKILLETSGGINESNIVPYAEAGIDIISSGALTHSYISSDFNMIIALK